MTLSPRPRHQLTATLVRDRIDPQLPDSWGVSGTTDTDDELLGKLRVLDLHVCSYDAMQTDDRS